MHTIELLQQCFEAARQLGYHVREEWLGGAGGGACEFAGRKWIFVDIALNADEKLEQIATALREDPGVHLLRLPHPLASYLHLRKAA